MNIGNLNPSSCLQCGKCSSGCPIAFDSEHTPRKIMRFLQWGITEEAYKSPFLWLCTSCYTCFIRCPKKIEIPEIIYFLRREAIKNQLVPDEKFSYYRSFREIVNQKYRITELNLIFKMGFMKFLKNNFLQNMLLFFKLLIRGKVK